MEEAPQRRRLTRRKEVKLTKVSPTRKRINQRNTSRIISHWRKKRAVVRKEIKV